MRLVSILVSMFRSKRVQPHYITARVPASFGAANLERANFRARRSLPVYCARGRQFLCGKQEHRMTVGCPSRPSKIVGDWGVTKEKEIRRARFSPVMAICRCDGQKFTYNSRE